MSICFLSYTHASRPIWEVHPQLLQSIRCIQACRIWVTSMREEMLGNFKHSVRGSIRKAPNIMQGPHSLTTTACAIFFKVSVNAFYQGLKIMGFMLCHCTFRYRFSWFSRKQCSHCEMILKQISSSHPVWCAYHLMGCEPSWAYLLWLSTWVTTINKLMMADPQLDIGQLALGLNW